MILILVLVLDFFKLSFIIYLESLGRSPDDSFRFLCLWFFFILLMLFLDQFLDEILLVWRFLVHLIKLVVVLFFDEFYLFRSVNSKRFLKILEPKPWMIQYLSNTDSVFPIFVQHRLDELLTHFGNIVWFATDFTEHNLVVQLIPGLFHLIPWFITVGGRIIHVSLERQVTMRHRKKCNTGSPNIGLSTITAPMFMPDFLQFDSFVFVWFFINVFYSSFRVQLLWSHILPRSWNDFLRNLIIRALGFFRNTEIANLDDSIVI